VTEKKASLTQKKVSLVNTYRSRQYLSTTQKKFASPHPKKVATPQKKVCHPKKDCKAYQNLSIDATNFDTF